MRRPPIALLSLQLLKQLFFLGLFYRLTRKRVDQFFYTDLVSHHVLLQLTFYVFFNFLYIFPDGIHKVP